VKKDFELWSLLVRSGGVIVFHDIIKSDRSSNYGVHILWEELKSTYKTEEIVADYSQHCFGIGILYIP